MLHLRHLLSQGASPRPAQLCLLCTCALGHMHLGTRTWVHAQSAQHPPPSTPCATRPAAPASVPLLVCGAPAHPCTQAQLTALTRTSLLRAACLASKGTSGANLKWWDALQRALLASLLGRATDGAHHGKGGAAAPAATGPSAAGQAVETGASQQQETTPPLQAPLTWQDARHLLAACVSVEQASACAPGAASKPGAKGPKGGARGRGSGRGSGSGAGGGVVSPALVGVLLEVAQVQVACTSRQHSPAGEGAPAAGAPAQELLLDREVCSAVEGASGLDAVTSGAVVLDVVLLKRYEAGHARLGEAELPGAVGGGAAGARGSPDSDVDPGALRSSRGSGSISGGNMAPGSGKGARKPEGASARAAGGEALLACVYFHCALLHRDPCTCTRVHVCMGACVRMYVHVCVCAHVHATPCACM